MKQRTEQRVRRTAVQEMISAYNIPQKPFGSTPQELCKSCREQHKVHAYRDCSYVETGNPPEEVECPAKSDVMDIILEKMREQLEVAARSSRLDRSGDINGRPTDLVNRGVTRRKGVTKKNTADHDIAGVYLDNPG